MPHSKDSSAVPVEDSSDLALMDQAAAWLVHMSSEECSDVDHIAFAKWQQQSPKHQAIVQSIQETLAHFQHVQNSPSAEISTQLIYDNIQPENSIFQSPVLCILLICGLLFGLLSWQILPTEQWLADQKNAPHQWQTQTLADHSEIQISGHSAYDLAFDHKKRLIKLYQGNILVNVAKDATRPFVIQTQYAQITALGTRFIVQQHQHNTVLIMLESKTKVQARPLDDQNDHQIVQVQAGQQLVINQQGLHAVHSINPDLTETAWQKHLFVAQQMPLDQVLDHLQNYHSKQLSYDAAALHPIVVNATLPLDDSALNLLAKSLPIELQPTWLGGVKIVSRQK